MLDFDVLGNGLAIVPPPYFVYDISRKMYSQPFFTWPKSWEKKILRTKGAFKVKWKEFAIFFMENSVT